MNQMYLFGFRGRSFVLLWSSFWHLVKSKQHLLFIFVVVVKVVVIVVVVVYFSIK